MSGLTGPPAFVALLALMVAVGPLPLVGSGRVLTPDQYLRLKLEYELSSAFSQPQDRCTPPSQDSASPRLKGTECSLLYGSVLLVGECHRLLKQGPCSAGQWLVLDKNTERAVCQFQTCPNHHVLVDGACVPLVTTSSERYCRSTLELIINEYGEAECECPVREVYYPRTGRCYPLFEQGPCRNGDSLQIVDGGHGSFADCRPSLCPVPGQVPMTPLCQLAKASPFTHGTENYQCYNLTSRGPCSEESTLELDLTLLDVVCEYKDIFGLFDSLPGGRPCSRGSRRDSLGRCRRELVPSTTLDVTTIPPTVKPGLYDNGSVCPDGYVFLAGTCLEIVNGT